MADLGRNIGKMRRKMTIHDPSALSSLVQTLSPPNLSRSHLTIDDDTAAGRHIRASSVPPSFLPGRNSNPGRHSHGAGDGTETPCSDDEYDDDDQDGYNSAASEGDIHSDDDVYLREFLEETGEGEQI